MRDCVISIPPTVFTGQSHAAAAFRDDIRLLLAAVLLMILGEIRYETVETLLSVYPPTLQL